VLGVLLVPALFSFLWFAVFGGFGLQLEMFRGVPIAAAVRADVSSALFKALAQLPLGAVLSGIATALILSFFVTSADSATFVLGMLSSRGAANPPAKVKLVWGALIAGIAAVLLLAGGLKGLQSASIAAAGPFAVVMIVMCASLWRALRAEDRERRHDERRMTRALHALADRQEAERR
jgi:glycine betaine transporter